MDPFEALYGMRSRSTIGWFEVGETRLFGPELVHQAKEKVKLIEDRIKTAQSHQNSYVDVRRRELEFEVCDWVFLKAVNVFDNMETKDMKSWTTMIMGYRVHEQVKNAIVLFHRIVDEGFRPNQVNFLAVLSACSHEELVEDDINCFRKMVLEYRLTPKIEHYTYDDLFELSSLLHFKSHSLPKPNDEPDGLSQVVVTFKAESHSLSKADSNSDSLSEG
ncbi:hypothetical protein T459_01921 [Capsicum annuum]|uniref:Pentatricopeptide repeat-containing protein n=1 Tax=Capsicum annuum TaxID=4072 RepID=A0A2G3AIG9_CAPAN|nr:hypothetical protein T459_01921 [Capsicum annuum]